MPLIRFANDLISSHIECLYALVARLVTSFMIPVLQDHRCYALFREPDELELQAPGMMTSSPCCHVNRWTLNSYYDIQNKQLLRFFIRQFLINSRIFRCLVRMHWAPSECKITMRLMCTFISDKKKNKEAQFSSRWHKYLLSLNFVCYPDFLLLAVKHSL